MSSLLPSVRLRLSFLVVLVVAMCASAFSQTATTTLLALTSGGNSTTSINAGTAITLTASVSAGSTILKQGQVNFCDATAPYCTDIHLLGTAQLTGSGHAQLRLRPAPGNYSFKAIFLGTPKTTVPYAPSTSSSAGLTVSGQAATAITIAQSGSSDDYTLTASAFGFSRSPMFAPSGTVSFVDTTTNNSVLGASALIPASGLGWVNSSNPGAGNSLSGIVTGDFNGDGSQDVAVGINQGSSANSSVAILLGDGQGNFTPASATSITGTGVPVAVADFNQDGIADLLLANDFTGGLTVLLGHGDGTFTQAAGGPLLSGYGALPGAVADFNGDGIPDIAAGGYYLVIFLGKGDGTFTPVPLGKSLVTPGLAGMVVADLNGDGIPDLAGGLTTISVYFGNGDGTFTPGPTTEVTTISSGIVPNMTAGDFNQDGKLDLAIPIPSTGEIVILLGDGDGTFKPAAANPTVGQWASRVEVGDFNGDGVPDIFVNAQTNLTNVFVLLGNGDGTFTVAPGGPPQQPCCWTTAGVDLNGDGLSDLASVDFYNNTVDVFLTATKYSTAAVTGITVSGQSPQQAIATYLGDPGYLPSQSSSTPLLAQASAPAFSPTPGGIVLVGQSVTLTSSTPGATIYYKVSGAQQNASYLLYFGPIFLNVAGTITIQTYATALNYGQSPISTATYTVVSSYPVPVLISMSPALAGTGGQTFTLTLNGSGFLPTSVVSMGATALSSQFVSSSQVTAQVTTGAIATAGIKAVTIQNPTPGGGASNALQFEVDSGTSNPVFPVKSATVTAGASAAYPVTLPSSATGISVQCLNIPSGVSCSYSASSGVLNILTSSSTPTGTYQITAVFTETLPGAAVLASPVLLLFPFVLGAARRRRLLVWIQATTLAVGLLVATSCGGGGGGGGGTQPQSHQVTSSGVVTLTVQ